ncbi:unnamed protein product [Rhodiola kirilowii]
MGWLVVALVTAQRAEQVGLLGWPSSRAVWCGGERSCTNVDWCKESGFLDAFSTITSICNKEWERKVSIFEKWGWSAADLNTAFSKQPKFMELPEKKIEKIMEYFVNVMELDPLFPMGVVSKDDFEISTVLESKEDAFIRDFVKNYTEVLPELLICMLSVKSVQHWEENTEEVNFSARFLLLRQNGLLRSVAGTYSSSHPSLQRLAVISIFSKPSIVSVRLRSDIVMSPIDISGRSGSVSAGALSPRFGIELEIGRGLLELQSAFEVILFLCGVLVSSMTALACTFRCDDAMIILKLLISCLRFYPQRSEGDLADFTCIAQCIVDAHVEWLLGLLRVSVRAVDTLSAVGALDSKLGVTILLAILFYINLFSKSETSNDMQVKLLGLLPSLASHSAMIPLIVQTILPFLAGDKNSVLYATATRLLCKTWEYNDRAFGSLQRCLQPIKFADFTYDRNISISMAACMRDVCKKNPDRGVDLILSVSACIESHDPAVKALGLECLSQLCEADVIDLYTAWDVIRNHVAVTKLDPMVARSLCLLLRWGAMDAEAHPEASECILKIIWDIGSYGHPVDCNLWAETRPTAVEALAHFEVPQLDRSIPEFRAKLTELLSSTSDCALLGAIEKLMGKLILYENKNRRRLVKEKKVLGNKVEKLLDVFPKTIFPSGNYRNVRGLPGAALFSYSLYPKDKSDFIPKELKDAHAGYENTLTESAASLHLSRNIFVALLTLKSWEPFMKRWIKENVLSMTKRTSKVSDTTLKAANDILQSLTRIAENAIRRTGENIALAIGAFCAILPPSVHAVKAKSTQFLLTWLSSNEHEYRQWSAALSLGVVSRCLHITDHKLKLQIINGLIEVACNSKSTLVKGACGVGLGLSCKSLLIQAIDVEESGLNNGTMWRQELDIVENMVKALCQMTFQLTQSSSDILRSICAFPLGTDDEDLESDPDSDLGIPAVMKDEIWGVAGLVMGLGNSVGAVYRAGSQDLVVKIKSMLISWISYPELQGSDPGSCSERCEIMLSVGSCLALPVVVAFCVRVELIDNDELEHLIHCYKDRISTLLLCKDPDNFHQSLLMASCVGAGNLLACILNEGVHSIDVKEINELLQLYKRCYSNPFPLINLGGMFGAVNALGALADIYLENPDPISSELTRHESKESLSVMGPLVRSSICEPTVTLLIQEMFVAAQNSEDVQLQQYAAWALSFLRHHLFSDANKSSIESSKSSPSVPEDSVVMKLSLWLMHLNYSEEGSVTHPTTVATVIRCLALAPRLPTLDWGAIMRRCMRYELQVAESPALIDHIKPNVRESCLEFSLVHANKVDLLQRFLDELTDLSRFESLELNLQSFILQHISDMIKVFSGSRLQKLFNDLITYFSFSTSFKKYSLWQKSLLRKSIWKGIYECLVEALTDASEHMAYFEKCMKLLFLLLPQLKADVNIEKDVYIIEEWREAVQCLEKASRDWLLNILQIHQQEKQSEDVQEVKKLQVKAKLVGRGSLALSELGRLKTLVLDSKSFGAWDVLIEFVAALQQADSSSKREWLLDVVQMSSISRYPSMEFWGETGTSRADFIKKRVLQFTGLIAGSFCKYMPLLILDRLTVLSDLPVTLRSLLTDPKWEPIAESVATHLFTAAERIYKWRTCLSQSSTLPGSCNIDSSEDVMADFLVQVLYHTCVSLRHYLPLDKQLRLTNMVVS